MLQRLKLVFIASFGLAASCATALPDNPFRPMQGVVAEKWAQEKKLPLLRVVFSGNVNGEPESCGCSVNPKGGLDRRWNFLKQYKTKNPKDVFVVDAGNAFFPAADLDLAVEGKLKAAAQALVTGHAKMGIQVQNVGLFDLAAGTAFLKDSAAKAGLTLLSSNWVDAKGQPLFETEKTMALADGTPVVILGLSAGGVSRSLQAEGFKVLNPEDTLKQKLKSIPETSLVLVLSDLGQNRDREVALKFDDRPMLIIGTRDLSSLEIPVHEGASLLVQGQFKGQQWGVVDIAWNPKADGWYNNELGRRLSERWDALVSEDKNFREKSSSSEQKEELKKIRESIDKLAEYAPRDMGNRIVYDYSLVNLTEEYKGENELTKLMRDLKKSSKK